MIHQVNQRMEDMTHIRPSTMLGAKSHSSATPATDVMDLHGVSVENITNESSGPIHLPFANVSVKTTFIPCQSISIYVCIDII